MDNYFVDRRRTPRDESGDYDFEHLNALDLPLFNDHLSALLDGREVQLPRFDFATGTRRPGDTLRISPEHIIIAEGIHGLNPDLLIDVPQERTFRVYISALTQLNVDHHNRISTTDSRLLRRIVRDAQYRGNPAKETINRWESVRRGEKKWIFPYQENADAMFNSALVYELAVLKPYVEPLLRLVEPGTLAYIESKRWLSFLQWFLPCTSDLVPDNSILREFVGSSIISPLVLVLIIALIAACTCLCGLIALALLQRIDTVRAPFARITATAVPALETPTQASFATATPLPTWTPSPTSTYTPPPATSTSAPTATSTPLPATSTPALPETTPTPIVCAGLDDMATLDPAPGQRFECTVRQETLTDLANDYEESPCSETLITLDDGKIEVACWMGIKMSATLEAWSEACRIELRVVKGTMGFTQAVESLIATYFDVIRYDTVCVDQLVIDDGEVYVAGYGR
jgi:uridine kinase